MTVVKGASSVLAQHTEPDSDQEAVPEFPPVPDSLIYAYGRDPTAEERAAHELQSAAARIVRARAEKLADGDSVRADIYERAMWCAQSMDVEPSLLRRDGTWWRVGRNSSHEFYLGYNAQREFCRAAFGEDVIREGDPQFQMDMWVVYRNNENRYRREHGDMLGVRGDAWMEASNGRLRRCYLGDKFSWSRVLDPGNLGYLGHY